MKKQKASPIYYKLMRISKTTSLLATMVILAPHSAYVEHLKALAEELETAIICCEESKSFYKTKDLLKD